MFGNYLKKFAQRSLTAVSWIFFGHKYFPFTIIYQYSGNEFGSGYQSGILKKE